MRIGLFITNAPCLVDPILDVFVQNITVSGLFRQEWCSVFCMARPRGFDETTVLERARDRFWPRGFAGTSIDEVAAATGLGKGSLYGAFGDKRQLYLRVFDRYCTEVTEATGRSLTGPDNGAYARLRAHILAVADATARDTGHLGCLLANGTAELAGRDPAVADRARRTFEALEMALIECIQQAQRTPTSTPPPTRAGTAGCWPSCEASKPWATPTPTSGHCARSPKPRTAMR